MLEAHNFAPPATATLSLAPARNMVTVAAFAGASAALSNALGGPLPGPNRRAEIAGVTYLWAGPANWLAISDEAGLEHRLRAAAAGLAAITDQSDGRYVFAVAGPDAREQLAKLVPIDLHPAAFGPDATALTLAGHIGVQIWREDEKFLLACLRSYAASLHHALLQAGRG